MSDDDFGIWGSRSRAGEDDDFGIWGKASPSAKKKRVRSKRVPQARDVESPVSPEASKVEADEEDFGLYSGARPELKIGTPPTAAGKPSTAPGQQRGELRKEEPAWYEPLLKTYASVAQGMMGNTLDEQGAAAQWVTDKLGITDYGGSFEENQQRAKRGLDRATSEYPYAHGAGQLITSALATTAAGPGLVAQTAAGGALGAGAEYADSRDPLEALYQGGMGAGANLLGGVVGKGLARAGAVHPEVLRDRALVEAAEQGQAMGKGGVRIPRPMEPAPVVPESGPPRPLANPVPPRPYEPTYGAPDVPEPRPLPVEASPGGYDPLAGQQFATPAGPPRPLPVDMRGAGIPPAKISPVTQGPGGRFQRRAEYPGELDMSPAPGLPAPPTEAPYGPSGARDWTFEFPASEAAMRGPAPRTGGFPRDPALEYTLGDVPAPVDALPRPRVGGPVVGPEPEVPYGPIGDLSTAPPPPSSLRVGPPPEQELRELAIRSARAEEAKSGVGKALSIGKALPGPIGTVARVADVADRFRQGGGTGMALDQGKLVPDLAAGAAGRLGIKAAWELGAPAAFESKVNAQDAEPVAYADGPTFNYAISETLHGGRTGLKPEDEQALTEAVVRGDDDAIRATSFRLRQKNPAYARQVERALRSYNEGDDR